MRDRSYFCLGGVVVGIGGGACCVGGKLRPSGFTVGVISIGPLGSAICSLLVIVFKVL